MRNFGRDRGEIGAVERCVVIPGMRAIAEHAWVNVLVGKIVPLMLFLGLFRSAGITPAVVAALAWSLGVIAYQRAKGHRIAGLVILSIIGNTAKSIVAISTGSVIAYFIQPTISTTLVGTAFLVSVPLGLPLAERLVRDFCPFDERTSNEPAFQAFWPKLSLLWAGTSLINGGITLYLLLTQSITTFVIIKAFLGPTTTSFTIMAGLWWFKRSMDQAGVSVVLARKMHQATAPITGTPDLQPATVPVR